MGRKVINFETSLRDSAKSKKKMQAASTDGRGSWKTEWQQFIRNFPKTKTCLCFYLD